MHEFAMPSDSAETKYTFGPFDLDRASRSFSRDCQAVALAPKTFDTLLLLVESHGRVLTKAQMMSALWPNIFVEEANLSYQISTLRKATGEQAPWIETSPKVGYRFIGPVQQASTAPVEVIVPPRPAHSRLVIVAFAGALTALGLIVGWLGWNRNHETLMAPSEPVPLTSYDGIEEGPSFSPDGSQVAFSWDGAQQDNVDIYVKAIGSGPPQRLTQDPATDCSPAWSPDGRYIAFRRPDVGIYLIPPTGGPERKLTQRRALETDHGTCDFVSWSADSKHIAFASPRSETNPAGYS